MHSLVKESAWTTSQSPMWPPRPPAASSIVSRMLLYRSKVRVGWLASRLCSTLEPVGEGKHEVVGEWSPKEPAGDGGQEAEGTTWSEEEDGFREVLTLPVPSESLVSFSEDSVRRRLGPVSLASLAVYKLSTVVRIECRKLSTAICCRSQGSCVATEVRRSRPAMSRALPASVSIVSNVSKATRLIQPNLDEKYVQKKCSRSLLLLTCPLLSAENTPLS